MKLLQKQTVIIYETFINPVQFLVAEGDLSRFDKLMINAVGNDADLQNELCDMLYDNETGHDTDFLKSAQDDFPLQAVRDGAIVIVAGFLP